MEKQGVLVERSREKLELEIGHFTLMQRDNVIIGCAALYPFSEENAAELACFVIHPEYHKQGMGEQLFAMMETIARKNGLKKLFVLTTQAEHWFLERGFSECSLDDLPVEKQDLYNYQRKSRVLTRTID
jgi:amino-acid N-acetyltransferase